MLWAISGAPYVLLLGIAYPLSAPHALLYGDLRENQIYTGTRSTTHKDIYTNVYYDDNLRKSPFKFCLKGTT